MKLFSGAANICEVNVMKQIYMQRYDDASPVCSFKTV